jgi:hypothetical protein
MEEAIRFSKAYLDDRKLDPLSISEIVDTADHKHAHLCK